jgi:integrase
MPKSKSRRKKTPKRVLALPDLEQTKAAVLNSLTSASGQRTYDHAIREFVAWYCSEPRLAFNRTVVLRYRIHLEQRGYAPATITLRLAAVWRVAYEAADAGLLRAAAARASIDKLAPHDLRRTCARLCHLAGGELDQIQFLLGHVSIQTTERYLGCKQKLRVAVNDRLGIEPDAA